MAEDFSDAPRLRDAADRPVGWLGLEDLAYGAQAGVAEVRQERLEQGTGLCSIAAETKMRINVRPEQPGPHQAHVVGKVTGALVALVDGLVSRVFRTQGAQAVGRQQLGGDHLEGGMRVVALNQWVRQGKRDHLVWPQTGIIALRAVDDVVTVASLRIPESCLRRFVGLRRQLPVAARGTHRSLAPVGSQAQGVVPE